MRLRRLCSRRLSSWEMMKLDPIAGMFDNHADLAGFFVHREYDSYVPVRSRFLQLLATVER